jgi:hypothetical protein
MAWLPKVHLGVTDDARRRRFAWAITLLVALAALFVVFGQPTDERPAPTPQAARPAITVTSASVLAREPYMGVACPTPNSTRCDRIGLAVWLKRRAVAVSADIRGRRFALPDRSLSTPVRKNGRKDFAGYLRGAGLQSHYHLAQRWLGNPTPFASVRLWIDYGHGPVRETRLRVPLMAGWG